MDIEPQTLVIKAGLGSVWEAREFVALAFGGWGLEDCVARTAVSELRRQCDQAWVTEGRSRGRSGLPMGGRGLQLVEALARRWGTRPLNEGGKAVWAEIDPVTA